MLSIYDFLSSEMVLLRKMVALMCVNTKPDPQVVGGEEACLLHSTFVAKDKKVFENILSAEILSHQNPGTVASGLIIRNVQENMFQINAVTFF